MNNSLRIIGNIKNNQILKDETGKYILKPKVRNSVENVYSYLLSRDFKYLPRLVDKQNINYEDHYLYEYIKEIPTPKEQKLKDLVITLADLHQKTSFYREIDLDEFKLTYENINRELDYLNNYYHEIFTSIENKVFMSPSEYLLIRNANIILNSIEYSKKHIQEWYQMIEGNRRQRQSMIHNNVHLSHFLKGDNYYLISWDHSMISIPILDLYQLYRNHYLDYDFLSKLKLYEDHFPLEKEEKTLLFTLISIPEKITWDNNHYLMTIKVRKFLDYLQKTKDLKKAYYSKDQEDHDTVLNKDEKDINPKRQENS